MWKIVLSLLLSLAPAAIAECLVTPLGVSLPASSDLSYYLSQSLNTGAMAWSLLLAGIAGLLTALSPCVYPLIPITLSIMGARSYDNRRHGFLVALVYVLGMCLVYTVLGALFASLGLVAGSLMSSPLVLSLVALIFLLFSLSTLGLFALVPQSLIQRLSLVGGRGFRGAFLMGTVAGVIAAPCTGPVLGFILTLIASKQDPISGIFLMASFSLGVGLPFLILGTFSNILLYLPQAGPWMQKIKYFIALLMLLVALYYGFLALNALNEHAPPPTSRAEIHAGEWHVLNASAQPEDLDKLLALAKSSCQKIIIDFYADWCVACRELSHITLSQPHVVSALQSFFLIKIDSSLDSPELTKWQTRYSVMGLPTIIVLDEAGVEIKGARILGFVNPDEFLNRLGF